LDTGKGGQFASNGDNFLAAEPDDVLDLDELWSFVRTKRNQRWVWIALCRRTRQVVACFIRGRSADRCRALRHLIPKATILVVPAARRIQGGAMPANCFSDLRGLAAVSTRTGKGGCSQWSNEVQSQEEHAWYGLSRGCNGLSLTTFYQKETRK
jgi:hypothetical protein